MQLPASHPVLWKDPLTDSVTHEAGLSHTLVCWCCPNFEVGISLTTPWKFPRDVSPNHGMKVVPCSLTTLTAWAQALPFSLLLSVPLTQLDLLPQMHPLGEAYPRVMLVCWLQWLTWSLFGALALFQSMYHWCFILSSNAYLLVSVLQLNMSWLCPQRQSCSFSGYFVVCKRLDFSKFFKKGLCVYNCFWLFSWWMALLHIIFLAPSFFLGVSKMFLQCFLVKDCC